jgi:thiol:disulfide interchange protein
MKILLCICLLFCQLIANKVEINFFIPNIQEQLFEIPFAIEINIPDGSHIYEVDDQDSPTKLEFDLPKNYQVTNLQWPPSKTLSLHKTSYQAFEGKIYVHGKIISDAKISAKNILDNIKLKISYTVCDTLCTPENSTLTPQIIDSAKWQNIPKPTIKQTFFSKQMLLMFIFAILGGIILNLMPCVLPILSLKVLQIAKTNHPKNLKYSGVFFTLGTLVSFWALASLLYIAKAAGHEIGWGFQLQSPIVVTALSIIFLLLALNLFGVFEIGTSLTKLSNKLDNSTKPTASFMSGALACVVATPCSAPFMGASVGFALTQSIWQGFAVFTGLALGLSMPYLLVCWHPAFVKILPKPGAWMNTLKTFLGFAMMASLVWLLHILAAQTAIDQLLNVLVSLLLTSLACWIYGNFAAFNRTTKSKITSIIAAIVILTAAFLNVFTNSEAEQLKWLPFSEQTVNQHQTKSPVFIDFTAKWCITCQVNKKLVLNTKRTKQLFESKNVTLIQADWTNHDPEITKALAKYNRSSIPLYVLLLPNGTHKILPEILTFEIIEEALRDLG